MGILQRFAVSSKQQSCEHQIMKARVFDEIFDLFIDNYEYMIENNSDILTVQTKCFKCYEEIVFKYNLITGDFHPSKNKYNMYDKALDRLAQNIEFYIRVFFKINFPITNGDLDKRAMMLHVKKITDDTLGDKSPRYYSICRTFSVCADSQVVNMIDGVISNHLELELDFPKFKRLYTALTKEFNNDKVTFKLAKK